MIIKKNALKMIGFFMPTLSIESSEKQVHLVIQSKAVELLADTFQAQCVSHTNNGLSQMYHARPLEADIRALLCHETWLLVRL